jgi:hypothetical protein
MTTKTFSYRVSRIANGKLMLWVESVNTFSLPQTIAPKNGEICFTSEASCFAAAQEHAREHGQTILPADLTVDGSKNNKAA